MDHRTNLFLTNLFPEDISIAIPLRGQFILTQWGSFIPHS